MDRTSNWPHYSTSKSKHPNFVLSTSPLTSNQLHTRSPSTTRSRCKLGLQRHARHWHVHAGHAAPCRMGREAIGCGVFCGFLAFAATFRGFGFVETESISDHISMILKSEYGISVIQWTLNALRGHPFLLCCFVFRASPILPSSSSCPLSLQGTHSMSNAMSSDVQGCVARRRSGRH